MAKPAPILTALGMLFMGVRNVAFGGGNVGKRYNRFLVHGREYLHISDGFAAPCGGSREWHPLPMASVQRPRDHAGDGQRSVCD